MKTFIEATEDFLKTANKPKTVRDIYNGIKSEIGAHSGDPYFTLSGILTQQVKKSNSNIFVVNYKKPRTLWLKSRIDELNSLGISIDSDDGEKNDTDIIDNKNEIQAEKELYPIIINILRENSIYSKRIDEKLTERGEKGLNKWINPDIVGAKYFFEEHSNDVCDLIENASSALFELYSYEVKKEIKLLNLKESYFQAVSNSSWANYGYLICENFDEENDELYSEMFRLVNSFGIGLIKVCTDRKDFKIIFQAKHNKDLDFATIENLCSKNDDFKEYINQVNNSLKIRNVIEP